VLIGPDGDWRSRRIIGREQVKWEGNWWGGGKVGRELMGRR
jgi:hypothetical protein